MTDLLFTLICWSSSLKGVLNKRTSEENVHFNNEGTKQLSRGGHRNQRAGKSGS